MDTLPIHKHLIEKGYTRTHTYPEFGARYVSKDGAITILTTYAHLFLCDKNGPGTCVETKHCFIHNGQLRIGKYRI